MGGRTGRSVQLSELVFDRLVLWGLRDEFRDMTHIFSGFRHAAERLGLDVVWVNDTETDAHAVRPGALVVAYNGASVHVPCVQGARYLLHNLGGDPLLGRLPEASWLLYQVYTDDLMTADGPAWGCEQWDLFTFFQRDGRALFQPWGTDLLPDEHHPPVFSGSSRVINWVGSVWDNELGQGNESAIAELVGVLGARGLEFRQHQAVAVDDMITLVRGSRIAPAFAGEWQVAQGYLPCRLFKNVSYGQLGITNVPRFADLLGDTWVGGATIAEQVDAALGCNEALYVERTRAQQELIAPYNYARKLHDISHAFESLE